MDLSSLITMIFSFAALRDWLKLAFIGGVLEALRRSAVSTYQKIVDSLWITALFEEDDISYNWIMVWLSKQPNWSKAREVEISTRAFGRNDAAVLVPGERDDASSAISGSRQLAYLPSASSTYSVWYKRRLMLVTRVQSQGGFYGRTKETLHLSILTHNHNLLNQILLEAKTQYKADNANTISIYVSDSDNDWRHLASRPKRPLRSIVLDPGIKSLLIDDAREFLESKGWYIERGIPFRRGYLLYGAPGSGKTSIIHSIAGELGLDIYIISISRAGLDDTSLNELISNLPEKCIALMEDIDVAFHQGPIRSDDSDLPEASEEGHKPRAHAPRTSRVSLSGLLNALDGVGAQEGRLLYATTNKFSALDPALCRPGRMDLHVEFKLASKFQAQALFRAFYLPSHDVRDEESEDGGLDSEYSSSTVRDHDGLGLPDEMDEKTGYPDTMSDVPAAADKPNRSPLHLSRSQVLDLSRHFAQLLPKREISMAGLQGYLMIYKTRPFDAVKNFSAWIEKQHVEQSENEKSSMSATAPVGSPSGSSNSNDDERFESRVISLDVGDMRLTI